MVALIKTAQKELNPGLARPDGSLAFGNWAVINEEDRFEVYPHPIGSVTAAEEAIKKCDSVFEEVLPEMTTVLNDYHQEENDEAFYRILLGPSLLKYLHQFYEKYLIIKGVLESRKASPNTIQYLHTSQWVIPVDVPDFVEKFGCNDLGAEQQFAQIMRFLGVEGEEAKVQRPLAQKTEFRIRRGNLFVNIGERFIRAVQQRCYGRSVILSHHYSGWTAYKLSLLSGFRFAVDDFRDMGMSMQIHPDWVGRRTRISANGRSEFAQLVLSKFLLNIPAIYLEAYKELMRNVRGIKRRSPDILVSATGLLGHNPMLSALVADAGKRTYKVLMQHGGNYGTDRINASEEVERRIGNVFLYWGNARNEIPVSALPLQRYRESQKTKNVIRGKAITLFLVEFPKFVQRLHTGIRPSSWASVDLQRIVEFLKSTDKVREDIRLKPYSHNYGKDVIAEIKDKIEWVRIEKRTSSHRKLILGSRICVFPFITTGYLQALSANIPTVIFLDRNFVELRPDALPEFKLLSDAGILHRSGRSAAEHIERVIEDLAGWWDSEKTVIARHKFLEAHGRASKTWVKEWIEIRESILGQDRR